MRGHLSRLLLSQLGGTPRRDLARGPTGVHPSLSPTGSNAGRLQRLSCDPSRRGGQRAVPEPGREAANARALLWWTPWTRTWHGGDRVLETGRRGRARWHRRGMRTLDSRRASPMGDPAIVGLLCRRERLTRRKLQRQAIGGFADAERGSRAARARRSAAVSRGKAR